MIDWIRFNLVLVLLIIMRDVFGSLPNPHLPPTPFSLPKYVLLSAQLLQELRGVGSAGLRRASLNHIGLWNTSDRVVGWTLKLDTQLPQNRAFFVHIETGFGCSICRALNSRDVIYLKVPVSTDP